LPPYNCLLYVSQVAGVGGDPISPNGETQMDLDGEKKRFRVGTHALSARRDNMEVVSPFKDGILSDWDVVEALCEHTLK